MTVTGAGNRNRSAFDGASGAFGAKNIESVLKEYS
jgi:hypothetical protein